VRLLTVIERTLAGVGAKIGKGVVVSQDSPFSQPRPITLRPDGVGVDQYVDLVLRSIDDALAGDRHDTIRLAAMKLFALVKDARLDEREAVAGLEAHALRRLSERDCKGSAEWELAGIIAYAQANATPDWSAHHG
jgi:hypothetical protein